MIIGLALASAAFLTAFVKVDVIRKKDKDIFQLRNEAEKERRATESERIRLMVQERELEQLTQSRVEEYENTIEW